MQNLTRKLSIVHQMTGDYRSCCMHAKQPMLFCSSRLIGWDISCYYGRRIYPTQQHQLQHNSIMHQSWCYSKYLLIFKIKIANKITRFEFNDWHLLVFTCSKSSKIESKNKEQELDTKNVSDEDLDTIEAMEDLVINKFHKMILFCSLPSQSTKASRF